MIYIISKPSKQFLFKIVKLKIKPNFMILFRTFSSYERYIEFKNEENSIFDFFRFIYRDCITLKIISTNSRNKSFFENLSNSFIFSINYNTDTGIRQVHDLERTNELRINHKFRKRDIEEISPPKRIYKKELIEQYNMANISEEPFIKYLCYYHILEHFYEIVYSEELIKIVKNQLTLPNFSIKKDREVMKLIDIVKGKIKRDREGFVGDELESLELVIKKYVDLDTLKTEISNINYELVDYYDKEKIPFSKGVPINFNDKDNLYKNLAKRVYFTRNALVHYKSNNLTENERGIYRPFKDKKDLLKEIPLIRLLAEEVIIKTSKIL